VIVGAMLVLAGFLASPVFRGRVPVEMDLGSFNLPIRDFYARCLKQGEAFDWMPQLFGGFFLTGEGQHGPYHPAHWLLYRWLPVDTAFGLEVFLPVAVFAAGMVFFLRKYVNLAGACMGALMATFSVWFVGHVQHPQYAAILAHTPWFLAAVNWAVGAPTAARRRLACAAIALLTGSQVLLGHPQALWFSLLTGSLFALFMLVGQRAGWGAWAAVLGGTSLGLCIGAVQLFTTYSMLTSSVRATVDDGFRAWGSAPPRSLWGVIAPYVLWDRVPKLGGVYFGCVPLILALWWVTAHRIRSEGPQEANPGHTVAFPSDSGHCGKAVRRLSLWAFLFAVLTAILALGVHGKLYCLQMRLPVVGNFRAPCRYFTLTQICIAILAALAFARLVSFVRAGQKAPWFHLALPWLAAGASAVMAVWCAARVPDNSSHFRFQAQVFTGPLLVGGAAAALTLAARGRQSGLLLLVLLAGIDIGSNTIGNQRGGKILWRKVPSYQEYVAGVSGPPVSHEGRVFDGGLDVDCLCFHGYRMINGYVGLEPVRCLDYGHVNTLRVAQVAWFRQPLKPKLRVQGLEPPLDAGWRAVPHPLPRARLVCKVLVSAVPGKDLKKIDVDTTALVSRPLELTPSAPGKATLTEDRPGKITVEVEAPQRQLLVVSEGYDAGWQARVDGEPVTLERVNGDFFGCVVEGGEHRVELAFLPASLRLGRIVSLAAFAVCLVVAFGPEVGFLRGWRPPPPGRAGADRVPALRAGDEGQVDQARRLKQGVLSR